MSRANETTRDTYSRTNINVESQTIQYAANPDKLKEDLNKARQEIRDVARAFDESVNDRGDDNRNFLGQLREIRLNETIENIAGEKWKNASTSLEVSEAYRMALKDLGYDNIQIIFSDPENSPQLTDENGRPKAGTAFVRKDGTRTIIINAEAEESQTKAGLIGTISEEGSHIVGKLEGRQIETGTNEKGLESTGRATNEYFKDKYKDDKTSIELASDGKDYSGVDFGENVGDKKIVNPKDGFSKQYVTQKQKNNVHNAFEEAYNFRYENSIDWKDSYEKNMLYRYKVTYYYLVALNMVKDKKEINENFKEADPDEGVFHNFMRDKIYVGDNPNKKLVDKNTGKEVVLDKNGNIVKSPENVGTFNYYTYELNVSKMTELVKRDKTKHAIDIYNWVMYGSGINDTSTIEKRFERLLLGTIVSKNYAGIKKWIKTKPEKNDKIGMREIVEYDKYIGVNLIDGTKKEIENQIFEVQKEIGAGVWDAVLKLAK